MLDANKMSLLFIAVSFLTSPWITLRCSCGAGGASLFCESTLRIKLPSEWWDASGGVPLREFVAVSIRFSFFCAGKKVWRSGRGQQSALPWNFKKLNFFLWRKRWRQCPRHIVFLWQSLFWGWSGSWYYERDVNRIYVGMRLIILCEKLYAL